MPRVSERTLPWFQQETFRYFSGVLIELPRYFGPAPDIQVRIQGHPWVAHRGWLPAVTSRSSDPLDNLGVFKRLEDVLADLQLETYSAEYAGRSGVILEQAHHKTQILVNV